MSDPTPTPNPPSDGGNNPGGETPPAGDGFQPITSQTDLDRIIGQRLERERARYADYPELRARAEEVGEIEASAEQVRKEAEAAVAGIPARVTEALKTHLVGVHQISAEDAELFLTANDPETLLKQVARLAGRTGERQGPFVPREGAHTPSAESPDRETVRTLFGGQP